MGEESDVAASPEVKEESVSQNPALKAWLDGGPTPSGMVVRCSGCRDCEREGHLPLNPAQKPEPEKQP
jgi:hypothetical protein